MKMLKKFMTVVSRRKSSSTSSPSSPKSPSRKRRAMSFTEESHRSLTSTGSSSDPAPWRVERIRIGAPGEADWWKEEEAMDTMTEDDTFLLSSSGVSESMDESLPFAEDNQVTAGAAKKLEKLPSSASSGGGDKRFHNCGLETWETARAAWTARPDESTIHQVSPSSPRRQYPVNQKELGKILTKASSLRTYELPRRTPLKDLVESYVSVWNGPDDM